MPGEQDALQPQQQQEPEQAPPQPEPAAAPAHQSILDRMDILEPGDHALLARILKQHPELQSEIIARAQEVCGNDCVAKALEILQGGGEQEQAPLENEEQPPEPAAAAPKQATPLESILLNLQVLEQSDVQLLAKVLRQYPEWYGEIVAEATNLLGEGVVAQAIALLEEKAEEQPASQEDEAAEEDEEEVEQSSKKKRPPKGGWVKRAAKYNERHATHVTRFNKLTKNSCVGEDGEVDPNLVWMWQSKHGLTPDGMVGPNTVAAARGARHGDEQEAQADESEQTEEQPNG